MKFHKTGATLAAALATTSLMAAAGTQAAPEQQTEVKAPTQLSEAEMEKVVAGGTEFLTANGKHCQYKQGNLGNGNSTSYYCC